MSSEGTPTNPRAAAARADVLEGHEDLRLSRRHCVVLVLALELAEARMPADTADVVVELGDTLRAVIADLDERAERAASVREGGPVRSELEEPRRVNREGRPMGPGS